MEDVSEEEVDELVDPEDYGWGEGGYVVHLGEGYKGGDANGEHVPRNQASLHGWVSMNIVLVWNLHHILLEGYGIPAVLSHHRHVPVRA